MKPKQLIFSLVLSLLFSLFIFVTFAQGWKTEQRVNILFGMGQVLYHGFNVEGNFVYKRLIFDYSHGINLRYYGNAVPTDLQAQHVAVYIPWTTGFGIGYRLTEWLNTRLEPKWHRFEYYYSDDIKSRNQQIASCDAFSLGIGVYGDFRPFKHKQNILKGLMISPSVRFWPTISSSWNGGPDYYNAHTMKQEKLHTPNAGVNLSPWVLNLSIGYSFGLK
ncbi:MAG: hypothetical protein C5B59_01775 [Bacteroidetes bacterium]|nr:MAG: hypothetical protein C5B59_01775 [Bacteroidota bacterium]